MAFTLLLGGARSGKSALAERIGMQSGLAVTLVVTAGAGDEEMIARITHHRASRPREWEVVEEPRRLTTAVERIDPGRMLILDCLTLWVANRLDDSDLESDAEGVALALADRPGPGVVVTNEVGLGIVPDNPMARRYRDVLGRVNTGFARRAERTWFVCAGRVTELVEPHA